MLLELRKKVHIKRFLVLSVASLLPSLFLARGVNEILVILGIYVATLLYLIMFIYGVAELFKPYTDENYDKTKSSKSKVIMLFVGKLALLVLAILLGVQIMGNRIIIPVINYIIQIFVLGVSFKKGK